MKEAIPKWVYSISKKYSPSQDIPLFGDFPEIPLDKIEALLTKEWGLEDCSISASPHMFRSKEEVTHGLGDRVEFRSLQLAPLEGSLSILLPKNDVSRLISAITSFKGSIGENALSLGLFDAHFADSLHLINKLLSPSDIALKLIDEDHKTHEGYCFDVNFRVNSEAFLWRILISEKLQTNIQDFFKEEDSPRLDTEVPVSLRLGRTSLDLEEWQEAKVGDFLFIDYSTYDLSSHKGNIELCIDNETILRGRYKEGSVKIKAERDFEEEPIEVESYPFDLDTPYPSEESYRDAEDLIEEDELLASTAESTEKPEPAPKRSPLTFHIEIDRLTTTLDTLSRLQAGEELDLGKTPEQGVFLSHNNQVVAKGELMMLGESLGIRILELG